MNFNGNRRPRFITVLSQSVIGDCGRNKSSFELEVFFDLEKLRDLTKVAIKIKKEVKNINTKVGFIVLSDGLAST